MRLKCPVNTPPRPGVKCPVNCDFCKWVAKTNSQFTFDAATPEVILSKSAPALALAARPRKFDPVTGAAASRECAPKLSSSQLYLQPLDELLSPYPSCLVEPKDLKGPKNKAVDVKKSLKKPEKGKVATKGAVAAVKLTPRDWSDRFQELIDLQNGMLLHVESFTPPEFTSKSPYVATMEKNVIHAASCLATLEGQMQTMMKQPRNFNILEGVLKDKKRRLKQCRAQHGRLKFAMETGGRVKVVVKTVHTPQCKEVIMHKGQKFMGRFDAEKRRKREEIREQQRQIRDNVEITRADSAKEGVVLPPIEKTEEPEEESFHRRGGKDALAKKEAAKAAAAKAAAGLEGKKSKKKSKKKKKKTQRRQSEMDWMQEQEGFSVFLDEIHRLENNMQNMDDLKTQLKEGQEAVKAKQATKDANRLTVGQAARNPVDPQQFTFFRKIDPTLDEHAPIPYTDPGSHENQGEVKKHWKELGALTQAVGRPRSMSMPDLSEVTRRLLNRVDGAFELFLYELEISKHLKSLVSVSVMLDEITNDGKASKSSVAAARAHSGASWEHSVLVQVYDEAHKEYHIFHLCSHQLEFYMGDVVWYKPSELMNEHGGIGNNSAESIYAMRHWKAVFTPLLQRLCWQPPGPPPGQERARKEAREKRRGHCDQMEQANALVAERLADMNKAQKRLQTSFNQYQSAVAKDKEANDAEDLAAQKMAAEELAKAEALKQARNRRNFRVVWMRRMRLMRQLVRITAQASKQEKIEAEKLGPKKELALEVQPGPLHLSLEERDEGGVIVKALKDTHEGKANPLRARGLQPGCHLIMCLVGEDMNECADMNKGQVIALFRKHGKQSKTLVFAPPDARFLLKFHIARIQKGVRANLLRVTQKSNTLVNPTEGVVGIAHDRARKEAQREEEEKQRAEREKRRQEQKKRLAATAAREAASTAMAVLCVCDELLEEAKELITGCGRTLKAKLTREAFEAAHSVAKEKLAMAEKDHRKAKLRVARLTNEGEMLGQAETAMVKAQAAAREEALVKGEGGKGTLAFNRTICKTCLRVMLEFRYHFFLLVKVEEDLPRGFAWSGWQVGGNAKLSSVNSGRQDKDVEGEGDARQPGKGGSHLYRGYATLQEVLELVKLTEEDGANEAKKAELTDLLNEVLHGEGNGEEDAKKPAVAEHVSPKKEKRAKQAAAAAVVHATEAARAAVEAGESVAEYLSLVAVGEGARGTQQKVPEGEELARMLAELPHLDLVGKFIETSLRLELSACEEGMELLLRGQTVRAPPKETIHMIEARIAKEQAERAVAEKKKALCNAFERARAAAAAAGSSVHQLAKEMDKILLGGGAPAGEGHGWWDFDQV
jgi:hypothetical protein